ncbi:MAG: DUF4062 domain-containing protein [Pyrinomonadaceae bacterium]
MTQHKKLQVFISSTYTDLQEERQAAVEAILRAGHIPAGMELFAAGDKSQMTVIQRWIDESDVYLLILGGRYGSLEHESQKSYSHLEYEYAVSHCKPIFAAVISETHLEEKVKKMGPRAMETEHTQRLREFRELVQTRMVRYWSDPRDIKLAIMETLAEFNRRDELPGWVHGGNAIDTRMLAAEIARLSNENAELKKGLPWLYKEEDLIKLMASLPADSSVWVITPNLFYDTQPPNMINTVMESVKRGVTYTYIYPLVNEAKPYQRALKRTFVAYKDRLIIRPVSEEKFSSLAITHYLILDPDVIVTRPARAFLELPIEPRGYWIEVDSIGAQGLVSRFYEIARGED